MLSNKIKKLGLLIKKSKKILLTTHINPDGDGIGSGLALLNRLTKMKKKVYFINRDPLPDIYKFLPKSERVKNKNKITDKYDLAIILECPELNRTGNIINFVKQSKYTVNIDHHLGNSMYGDLNIVEPDAAAVGVQLFHIMKQLKWKIDKDVATCLYTSIITDTGSFKYSNTTPEVHIIASELLKSGANPEYIASEVYSTTYQSTKLLEKMFSNLKLESHIGWSFITQKMLKDTGAKESETDNFINFIRSIREVEIAMLFKEVNKKKVKVSFRSKNKIDVNYIAKKFNGGGHKYASGCVVNEELKTAIKLVLTEVKKYYEKINENN